MMFFSISVFIDNLSLVYELQNIKPINNYEHIKIIGVQALEIQKNKTIIYKLSKIIENQTIKPHNKKLYNRKFNKSFY